jgi:hypothetical protein
MNILRFEVWVNGDYFEVVDSKDNSSVKMFKTTRAADTLAGKLNFPELY